MKMLLRSIGMSMPAHPGIQGRRGQWPAPRCSPAVSHSSVLIAYWVFSLVQFLRVFSSFRSYYTCNFFSSPALRAPALCSICHIPGASLYMCYLVPAVVGGHPHNTALVTIFQMRTRGGAGIWFREKPKAIALQGNFPGLETLDTRDCNNRM